MVSPWPPSTTAVTFSTETSVPAAMNVRKRARIEHAGHADHSVLGELRNHQAVLRHGVQRVGHDNDECIGRKLGRLFGGGLDDFVVGQQSRRGSSPVFAGNRR